MTESSAIPIRPGVADERVRILVLDHDAETREALAEIFPNDRFRVTCAETSAAASDALERFPVALLLVDFAQADLEADRFLREISRLSPDTVVVALTGRGSVKEAVEYMRDGAYDVVTKPFGTDDMARVVEKAMKHQAVCRHNEELKRKLATSEKLAVIGRLASGVAHELNSPLDGVLRFVNLSIDKLPEGDSVREYLVEAKTGLVRMADIVRSLLRFSRNLVVENEPKALHPMLVDAAAQVRHANASSKIVVDISVPDETLAVPAGLIQVFTNLIKNALDAIGDRPDGRLRIEAEGIDDVVEIRFVDNGCGIPEKDRRKIFEPFFTTKDVGKGTGLGLAICARIVEKFNGAIDLSSEVDRGTTFFVRVPRKR
ncbi:MAG: response regulator [Planctomycetes bacterium]|nr:response regulator [Planctomycetota bacterium]MBI3848577.1 response regulator [Planctomycetota bacterium]